MKFEAAQLYFVTNVFVAVVVVVAYKLPKNYYRGPQCIQPRLIIIYSKDLSTFFPQDILFDAYSHQVKKFILHTNFPGHYNFNM